MSLTHLSHRGRSPSTRPADQAWRDLTGIGFDHISEGSSSDWQKKAGILVKHHTRRGLCVSQSQADLAKKPQFIQHPHATPAGFNLPNYFGTGKTALGPNSHSSHGWRASPAPKCVGAPHPLRAASCISAALNPPPVSPCSPCLQWGHLPSLLSEPCPRTPLPGHPCSPSGRGHPALVRAVTEPQPHPPLRVPHAQRKGTQARTWLISPRALQGHDQTDPLPNPSRELTHTAHPVITHRPCHCH